LAASDGCRSEIPRTPRRGIPELPERAPFELTAAQQGALLINSTSLVNPSLTTFRPKSVWKRNR
jgi:hypothetical protein